MNPLKFAGLILTFTLVISSSACADAGKLEKPTQIGATQTEAPASTLSSPTLTLSATPGPVVDPTRSDPTAFPTGAAAEQSPSNTRYRIGVSLDYRNKIVEVEQVIETQGLPADLNQIDLVVEANRYPGAFTLNEIVMNDLEVSQFALEGNLLQFDLPGSINLSAQNSIRLRYTLTLPVIPDGPITFHPQVFGYTERQLNLADWYPFLPPVDERGEWVVHPPEYFGETLVQSASDFDVSITLTGSDAPLIIAASCEGIRIENTYNYQLAKARSFVITISPDYQVLETEVYGMTVRAYGFKDSAAPNTAVLEYAAQALEFFSRRFGPLPRQTISVVEADFLDGMEYDGLYFVSKGFYNLYDGTVKGYLSLITVHEMAHQWWYALVGNDQDMEPWLDEGLATFAELEFIEHYYPDLIPWWWSYRVDYYQPEGFINLPVGGYPGYVEYRNAVYLRSAHFFADLRKSVGEEVYYASIRRYIEGNYQKIASAEDFWQSFPPENTAQLTELRGQYFSGNP
jgi:hypothetical protein